MYASADLHFKLLAYCLVPAVACFEHNGRGVDAFRRQNRTLDLHVSGLAEMVRETASSPGPFRNAQMSKAALTHKLRKLRAPSKCRECDSLVVFHGAECGEVRCRWETLFCDSLGMINGANGDLAV